jgi:hypothetical protein
MMRGARALLIATWFAALPGLLGGGATPPAGAEGLRRYSGHVMDVDLSRGTLVVEELGRRGVPIRHEVRVDPDTPVVTASRLRLGDMRGRNTFGEVAVALVDVLVGDFVVVEGVDLDGQTVASRVTIVETRRTPAGRPPSN